MYICNKITRKMKQNKIFERFVTRLLTWLGFGTSAFAFVACYAPPTERFHAEIDPQEITLPSEDGGEVVVSVRSNGDWMVDYDTTFLSVTPHTGWGDTTLTIRATENLADTARHAVILLGDGDMNYEIHVTQLGKSLE
jgi:hypothetical protein